MLKLTFACHDYDHVRDIFEPEVVTEGVKLTQLKLQVEEIFLGSSSLESSRSRSTRSQNTSILDRKSRLGASLSSCFRLECFGTRLYTSGETTLMSPEDLFFENTFESFKI